jgi:hypothetical protein
MYHAGYYLYILTMRGQAWRANMYDELSVIGSN